jgi:hypothetical protein
MPKARAISTSSRLLDREPIAIVAEACVAIVAEIEHPTFGPDINGRCHRRQNVIVLAGLFVEVRDRASHHRTTQRPLAGRRAAVFLSPLLVLPHFVWCWEKPALAVRLLLRGVQGEPPRVWIVDLNPGIILGLQVDAIEFAVVGQPHSRFPEWQRLQLALMLKRAFRAPHAFVGHSPVGDRVQHRRQRLVPQRLHFGRESLCGRVRFVARRERHFDGRDVRR